MIFKESIIFNCDRSGARKVKVFHTYHRLKKRYAMLGEYMKVSVKTIERRPLRIRGKRYRPTHIGYILRGLYSLSIYNKQLCGSQCVKTSGNTMITLKKRGIIKSPYILSPIGRPFRVKKFFYIFDNVL